MHTHTHTHAHTHAYTHTHTHAQALPVSSLLNVPGIRQDQIALVMLKLHNPFDVPIKFAVAETVPSGPRAQAMVNDMLTGRGSLSRPLEDGEPILLHHVFARDIVEVCNMYFL